MASLYSHINPVFKKLQEDFFKKSIGFIRNASKKGVGKGAHGRCPHFGFKKKENSIVRSGEILYNQIRLQYCPGLNVGVGRIAKLYAKAPGRVVLSVEKTNFKSDDQLVQRCYSEFIPKYKEYINVIPEPMHIRFKLVEKF